MLLLLLSVIRFFVGGGCVQGSDGGVVVAGDFVVVVVLLLLLHDDEAIIITKLINASERWEEGVRGGGSGRQFDNTGFPFNIPLLIERSISCYKLGGGGKREK